ncbi:hypothetical protein BEP19_07540 [Ammoniphilus oxalaticus]|uniref:Flagellar motor switch phosphatase FliY n=1 Tax=Ammoniphilus oxalaticus TaxID=66863 RepID=A0A419SK20_9BACL|nr:flagellar motor switch phosphatase FliY [Ammoniphilus oxalaticus]RKD24248.1 hypothetical protein BEP19_07540 [Ammoniphilus oxalaticus]
MSDNHILSQDEINALLSGGLDNEETEQESQTDEIDQWLTLMEQDALGEIGNISLGNAATSLSILLGQDVDITTPKVHTVHQSEFKDLFPTPHVGIHVDYTDGFLGMNLFVLQDQDAKIIADLMMGGTGRPQEEELSELHLSAVQEAMNQMMGSAATSMSTLFDRLVNITPPAIRVLDAAEGELPYFSEDIIIGVSFRLKIGELVDSNMIQLIPLSFAKEMVGSLLGEPQTQMTEEPVVDTASSVAEVETEASEPVEFPIETDEPSAPASEAAQKQVTPVSFPSFTELDLSAVHEGNLNLLMDIKLQVSVELGRSKKKINDILGLHNGSIVELERLAGEPVDVLVNNKLIAKGEVVVLGENFAVRLTEILNSADRLKD